MNFAERNTSGLIFRQQNAFVSTNNFSRALDHNPVLCAVMMFLQTEAGTGFDLDTLDLEALAVVDAVIPTPWAVYLAMQSVFFPTAGRKLVDDLLDVLTARFIGNQHSFWGFDDDEVFHANQRDKAAARMSEGCGCRW